jgi:hypothetical protein
MLVVAFGRAVGFIADGFDAAAMPPFVIEIVIAGVMYTAHKRFSKT